MYSTHEILVMSNRFTLGAVFGTLTMVVAPLILLANLYSGLLSFLPALGQIISPAAPAMAQLESSANELPSERPTTVLLPIVPGVTVPASHLVFIFLTLLINGIFHELGHAIAAVNEDVRVEAFGGLVHLIIFPGAFVELHTEQVCKSMVYNVEVMEIAYVSLGLLLGVSN